MSKVRDISNLSNVIRTDASGNVSFVSGSTTLATINTSGQLSGSSPVLSSSYALNATSASYAVSASNATNAVTASFANAFTVANTLTAQTLVVQTITSSVDFVTGSTRFGSSLSTSTHQFTGSVSITGSLDVITNGTEFQVTSTGVNFGNVIGDTHNITGSVNISGSFYVTTGSVGIGTTGQIESTSGWTNLVVNGTITGLIGVRANDTNFGAMYSDIASNSCIIQAYGISNTGSIRFLTTSLERMSINGNGNVGIGAYGLTTPPSKLSIQFDKSVAFTGLGVYDSQAFNAANHGGTIGFGGKYNSSSAYTEWSAVGGMKSNTSDGDVSGDINFYTRSGGSGMTERMKITHTGNVAINTSNSSLLRFTVAELFSSHSMPGLGSLGGLFGFFNTDAAGGPLKYGLVGNVSGVTGAVSLQSQRVDGTATAYNLELQPNGGNVVIGNTTAAKPLSVWTPGGIGVYSNNSYSPSISLDFNSGTNIGHLLADQNAYYIRTLTSYPIYIQANAANGVYLSVGATSFTGNSDERLKNINSNIENALDKISTLRAVNFSWKSDETNKENLGLIAQDVEQVFPQVIDKVKLPSKVDEEQTDDTEYLGIRYTELVPVLVKAIQELKAEINELKAQING
jgi:hypothetical protein